MNMKFAEIYDKYFESSESFSLEDMAVHCKNGDFGFNFIITVGRAPYINQSNYSKKEQNLPYAYVFIKEQAFYK